MKIFTGAQIHELDQYTIEHEPIKSIDLMERAAKYYTNRSICRFWKQRWRCVSCGTIADSRRL